MCIVVLMLGYLNDMWRFDVVLKVWEYLGGSGTSNSAIDLVSPYPGSSYTYAMAKGNDTIYMYGGLGLCSDGLGIFYVLISGYGRMNVFWKYYIGNNTWSFLGGDLHRRQPADYSIPFPDAMRLSKMVFGNDNALYLFAGETPTSIVYCFYLC